MSLLVATSVGGRRVREGMRVLGNESLPIVVWASFAGLELALLPRLLSTDGWLSLVAGRLVVQHGLPHTDTLTVLGSGRHWVDQQWLGQLLWYALERLGGIRAVLGLNLAVVTGAFVAAGVAARRRGGRSTTVALVSLCGLLPFLVTAMNVRTQSFAYPAFVGLVVALATARLSWRVLGPVLLLLLVWANVHGSVLLAVALVVLRGVAEMWDRRQPSAPVVAAVALAPLCLLASPYHVHLVSYYGSTAFNGAFSTYLSQWAPTTFSPIAAPLLVLVFGVAWLLARAPGAYTTFDRLLLVLAAAVGLMAVRNWPFATLLVVMLAPQGIDRGRAPEADRPWPAAFVGFAASVAVAAGATAGLARPMTELTRIYPAAAGVATAQAAQASNAPVYASISFGDWLLWRHPELAGKVALDARYELLDAAEIRRMILFDSGSGVDAPPAAARVFLLDPKTDKQAINALRPVVRTLYDTDDAFVAAARKD